MPTVNVNQAKTHLSKLLAQVEAGEDVIIARAGVPVARLTAIRPAPAERVPGTLAGRIEVSDDFDAPIPEEWLTPLEPQP